MIAWAIILSRSGKEFGCAGLPVPDAASRAWLAATPPAHERRSHAQAGSKQINERYYTMQYYINYIILVTMSLHSLP